MNINMTNKIMINCAEDNKFEFEQDRYIMHSCNRTFALEEDKIFYVETLGYGDEIIGQYYTICPYCGYIVLLNGINISDTIKIEVKQNYFEDPYQYRKNSLISQLIYLESKTPKTKTRTLY